MSWKEFKLNPMAKLNIYFDNHTTMVKKFFADFYVFAVSTKITDSSTRVVRRWSRLSVVSIVNSAHAKDERFLSGMLANVE